jgi:hypothetical protein
MKLQEIRAIAKNGALILRWVVQSRTSSGIFRLRKVIRLVITQRMNARTIAYGNQIV